MIKISVLAIIISLCLGRFEHVSCATLSCTLDRVVEVTINKTDNKVSCSAVGGPNQQVTWQTVSPSDWVDTVGTCQAAAGDHCTGQPALGFTPSRPTDNISIMTINAMKLNKDFIGRRLQCQADTTETCDIIDLIYPAEAVCSYDVSTLQWTINATCNISKVYSNASRYFCQFFRAMSTIPQQIEVQGKQRYNASVHSDPNYRTGICGFDNKGIPPDNGVYYYRALILPGYLSVVFKPLTVAAPSVPTISCVTQSAYVAENEDLHCTCSSAYIGLPGGRLMFIKIHGNDQAVTLGNHNQTSQPIALLVNRTHNGQQLRCDVDWVRRVNGTTFYTITVAYGPDSVHISGNRTFYTDSQGTKYLTLRCQPVDSNPASNLTYSWSGSCAAAKNDTCTFKPRPPGFADGNDVNSRITCTASNSFNRNTMANTSVLLDLKYAPRDSPTIRGYSENEAVYQGDPLTLSCSITGGDPPVTSVTVACSTRYSNKTSGQSSLLTIDLLTESDHGVLCTCHGQWILPEYYTLTAKTNLTVYSPPSYPSITPLGGISMPYMEYDKVTLTCSITRSGHPKASLSWSNHFGGKVNYSSDVTSSVYFDSISKDLNGVNVTCHATNNFTHHKQVDINNRIQLIIYYRPRLMLLPDGDTLCNTNTESCLVTEGDTLFIRCAADSNPPPQNYSWTLHNGQQLSISPNLTIPAAGRNHSGLYSVVVVTGKPDSSDIRLPLSASSNLTIIVKYGASKTRLRLSQNTSSLVTVRENDKVVIDCSSYGRPTPNLQLFQDDRSVLNVTGNILALLEEENSFQHAIAIAQCNDTGTYRCSADNEVGKDVGQEVKLRVNCRPRKTQQKDDVPLVTFSGQPVTLTFSLEAVPVPDQYEVHHYSPLANSTSFVGDDVCVKTSCFRTFGDQHEYAVTCNVTLDNVTDSSADGVYSFRAENNYGYEDFRFEVKFIGNSQSKQPINVGGLVGGLVAGLLVVVAVAAAVCILRKRIKNKVKKAGETADCAGNGQKPKIRKQKTKVSKLKMSAQKGVVNIPDYEVLDVRDIGKLSEHAECSPYQNCIVKGDPADSKMIYSTLSLQDIGQKSEYADLSLYQNHATDK